MACRCKHPSLAHACVEHSGSHKATNRPKAASTRRLGSSTGPSGPLGVKARPGSARGRCGTRIVPCSVIIGIIAFALGLIVVDIPCRRSYCAARVTQAVHRQAVGECGAERAHDWGAAGQLGRGVQAFVALDRAVLQWTGGLSCGPGLGVAGHVHNFGGCSGKQRDKFNGE